MRYKRKIQIFIATLYRIAKRWKESRCPLVDDKQMCYIQTMEYYSTIQEKKYCYMLQHDVLWKHFAKLKKPDTKGHILYDSIYIECPE